MRASTTTFSRMETFLISIFVIAGEQNNTYFRSLFSIFQSISVQYRFCNVINIFIGQVSPGLQERVQLSPSVQSMGDHLGSRQETFLLYLSLLSFIFYTSGQISSPQFYLFIALSLVENYRDIIIDR